MQFAELLEKARAGDGDALDSLIALAADHLALTKKIRIHLPLKKRFGESDAVQLTLFRVYEKFSSFKGGTEAEWKAWLERIADNVVADAHRYAMAKKRNIDRDRQLDCPIDSDASGPGKKVERRDSAAHVREAISGLPEDQRLAIRLRYDEEATLAEIGKRLAMTPDCVVGLLRRALKAIRNNVDALSRDRIAGKSDDRRVGERVFVGSDPFSCQCAHVFEEPQVVRDWARECLNCRPMLSQR